MATNGNPLVTNISGTSLVPTEPIDIQNLIYMFRGQQVMLDSDLAMLYQVETLHRIAGTFGMTLSEFLDYPELNEYSVDDEDENE